MPLNCRVITPLLSMLFVAVFLVHAITDKPIEIATNIIADLKRLGVPARLDLHEEAGHGVGNLIPQRVKNGFPGAQWPKALMEWLATLDARK